MPIVIFRGSQFPLRYRPAFAIWCDRTIGIRRHLIPGNAGEQRSLDTAVLWHDPFPIRLHTPHEYTPREVAVHCNDCHTSISQSAHVHHYKYNTSPPCILHLQPAKWQVIHVPLHTATAGVDHPTLHMGGPRQWSRPCTAATAAVRLHWRSQRGQNCHIKTQSNPEWVPGNLFPSW